MQKFILRFDTFLRAQLRSRFDAAVAKGTEAALLRQLQREIKAKFPNKQIDDEVEQIAETTDEKHRKGFYASLGGALGATVVATARRPGPRGRIVSPITPVPKRPGIVIIEQFGDLGFRRFLRDSTGLIKSVRDTAIPRMRRDITFAKAAGQDPLKLARRWETKGLPLNFGTIQGRAQVISRDQLGSLNAELTRRRQENAGVKSYIWRTMLDDRVRDDHENREGEEFLWSEPPSDGNPGEPINCRCHAEAVIRPDDILARPNVVELEAVVVAA
jgi:SPP1 gp7 family putative phage head morphogenesis protein